ncbi:DNA/RNA nuclease SfsA [Bacteriovorax sp. Seq25_V]|uniref:DNA/RNA nuclease SfsA n=1 Tax=Bacteriovorax sp. Seq25_V TaxID=1201288 RepID=UPI000389F9FC|nr:DNA/RNA nuclease SfsA [Bacteriovorax sp. Seq25_V]EQC46635.1 sugar fermentation stimulation protein [Bacteriovorax sp. Seq25_V]
MKFENELIKVKVIKRYKRFLVDAILEQDHLEHKKDDVITIHTANTGSMKTCLEPGWNALISFHDNPKRKLKYSLELTNNGSSLIGVNTSVTNSLAIEAIENGKIKELQGFDKLKPEYKIGKSRIDILLYDQADNEEMTNRCFVEVKNVSMKSESDLATFPDAVTERGQKHLNELMEIVKGGERACMLYIIQREDVSRFKPAKEIDPEYARLLKEAKEIGVEILVYRCSVTPKEVKVDTAIPYEL